MLRADWKLPGTPFDESTLGQAQAPWLELLRSGSLPEPRRVRPPADTLVAPHWRDMLETAPATPLTEYHLGVAQWHAGDRAQAVRSWERGLELAPSRWPLLRCLAVADQESGNRERAADRYADAFDDLCHERRDDGEAWTAATAALGRETLEALLAAGRTAEARSVWERLYPAIRARGRFRLIEAGLLLAEGRPEAARTVFEEGFEVADLREGAEAIGDLWSRISDEPLPPHHDFRMRAAGVGIRTRQGLCDGVIIQLFHPGPDGGAPDDARGRRSYPMLSLRPGRFRKSSMPMRERSSVTAVRAIDSRRRSTVVRGGEAKRAASMSSKPARATSLGTLTPLRVRTDSAPTATTSLKQKRASKRARWRSSRVAAPTPDDHWSASSTLMTRESS